MQTSMYKTGDYVKLEERLNGQIIQILYSAAVKEFELEKKQLAGDSAENRAPSSIENDRPINIDPNPVGPDAADLDDLAVRIRSWDVVQRYNDVLLSLAEGKSVAKVSAAVNGLMQSLTTFPLEDIARAVSSVSPNIGVLNEVLALAEYERSRRKFIAAVKKAAPIIGVPIREMAESGKEKKKKMRSIN